ncbi:MAG: ribosomal-processing cysteine protease Prp [Ruminococcus sp.]|nr:ribosomal-processing cysteine protease Prp [Ruminococcus sp.]
MLKVKAYTDIFKIKMDGHSYYEKPGKDIVCAGASMLFYALAKTLPDFETYLEEEPFIHIDEGKGEDGNNAIIANIVAIPKKEFAGYFSIMFTQTLNGLQLLAEAYPENISVELVKSTDEAKPPDEIKE